jgi:hypothetical protein
MHGGRKQGKRQRTAALQDLTEEVAGIRRDSVLECGCPLLLCNTNPGSVR